MICLFSKGGTNQFSIVNEKHLSLLEGCNWRTVRGL